MLNRWRGGRRLRRLIDDDGRGLPIYPTGGKNCDDNRENAQTNAPGEPKSMSRRHVVATGISITNRAPPDGESSMRTEPWWIRMC